MNEHPFGRQHAIPLHTPAMQEDAAENNQENSPLQAHAAAQVDAVAVENQDAQAHSPDIEEYTISVEQVRAHLQVLGLSKSKDTVQRWCRSGDLDCRKRGVLNRFFTTETSLKLLEKKLLPDMIAEETGPMLAHAGANAETNNSVQPQAPVEADERSRMKPRAADDAAASSSVPSQVVESGAQQVDGLPPSVEVAELRAKVAGLTSQLAQEQTMRKFLQEEVVSARGQRGDVVKIAEQMLGTLEAMAIGGRLEKPKPTADAHDPVRYQPINAEESAV